MNRSYTLLHCVAPAHLKVDRSDDDRKLCFHIFSDTKKILARSFLDVFHAFSVQPLDGLVNGSEFLVLPRNRNDVPNDKNQRTRRRNFTDLSDMVLISYRTVYVSLRSKIPP